MDSVCEQSVERAQVDVGSLLRSSNLLDDLEKVMQATGFAGDHDQVKLIYLAFVSRLLDRPVSLAIKGSSAAGKSYAIDRVTRLMPEDAYLKMTGMSPASLYYSNEKFAHRVLLINEADGIDSRKLAYTLRSLLTERELQLHTTVPKKGGGREGIVIRKEGPVAVITTTTSTSLHAETETRLFSLTVADDAATTARMIAAVDTPIPEKVVRQWIALQECIAHNAAPIHIPYLEDLLRKIPPVSLRLRRDKNLLIGLIKSHALLHVHKRSHDDEGRIVAIWADYEAVRHLLNPILSEMVEMTVSPQTHETVNAVIEIMEESETRNGVSITELADALGLDKSTVSRRVKRCVEDGYLVNGAGGRGRRALLFLGDPLPTGRTILPSKRSIQEG
jgi:DNA-binding transcriptional ArsR family regulator